MADIKVFAENLEDSTKEQIEEISSCPAFEGAKIRIMPDAETIARDDLIQFNRDVKRAVPTGFSLHRDPACVLADFDMESRDWLQDKRKVERSMGTLGGGNHFIELDEDEDGCQYLVVHTGSRNMGKHHQALAQKTCTADIPDELKYLVEDLSAEYLVDMHNCQRFSNQNRKAIVAQIVERTGIRLDGDGFTTMHNYISEDGMIRRCRYCTRQGKQGLELLGAAWDGSCDEPHQSVPNARYQVVR